jgi:hypothetical protein
MVEKSEEVVRVIKTTAAGWHCEGGQGNSIMSVAPKDQKKRRVW